MAAFQGPLTRARTKALALAAIAICGQSVGFGQTSAQTSTPPPPGVQFAPGVTTQPLTYRPGDVFKATGEASLSERLNGALPRWIRFSGELRDRAEGYENSGYKPGSSDLYDLYRMRLGMLIQPTSWVRVFVEAADDRAFVKHPQIPPFENTWDVQKAYIELGNTESTGFGLRVGRQELYFGNGRFVGNSWWSNVMRSFDAVRGSYQNRDFRVDVFASSVVITRDGVTDHHNQSNNLHGIYGTIKNRIVPKAQIEPYTFWHLQHNVALKGGKVGHLDQWTYGVRMLGLMPANFDYRTEMAVQRGHLGPASIKAWTGHWVLGNTLPFRWKPRPFVEYNYASGDRDPKNLSETDTFDPIYPSTHDKLGLADQIGWRNIRDARFGVDIRPLKKWALNGSIHDFRLANAKDALYPTRGSVVARDTTGKSGSHIGEELDFQAVYKPNPQVQLGAGIGHLFSGEFLNKTTKGKDYTYPYVLIDYVF